MSSKLIDSVRLEYRAGTSDKVYELYLHETKTSGVYTYEVVAQYGRRGSTLKVEPKGSFGSHAAALTQFAKVKAEKLKKGYVQVSSASATSAIADPIESEVKAVFEQFLPQLLNPVELDEAQSLLTNPQWVVQEKKDGERQMLSVSESGEVMLTNRMAQSIPLTKGMKKAAEKLNGISGGTGFIVDGERIGDKLHVFDVLKFAGRDFQELAFIDRMAMLDKLTLLINDEGTLEESFAVVKAYATSLSKKQLFERIKREGGEGVVFKKADSIYTPGRPASGGSQLKHKFVQTATVRVGGVSSTKRSVSMQVVQSDGTWAEVGNVTVPVNQEIPKKGDLIEVRYLYAYKQGSLFQPVLLGPRTDVAENECTVNQLKYKQAS